MLNYPILICLGLAPSFIWLLFFLRKDKHPESNSMVLKIFLWGMLSTMPVVLIELGIAKSIVSLGLNSFLIQLFYIFIGIALVEEMFKYLVVKKKVMKDPEFDEPVDIILYMIIAALGFAALENILIMLPLNGTYQLFESVMVSVFRFAGATFLHALCSGLVGYYLALSFMQTKNRLKLAAKGMAIAVVLHGLYDFSIMKIDGAFKFIIPALILIGLAVFMTMGFKKVKKLKSVCKLKKI